MRDKAGGQVAEGRVTPMKERQAQLLSPARGSFGTDERFIIKNFDEIQDLEEFRDKTLIITDGWQDGPAAAVLRGGIHAHAVLDVLSHSGVKDLKIFHIEEKLPDLEDVFLSSVVKPAQSMFDHVSVVWKNDANVYRLVSSVGNQYGMLLFGAPLADSEILPFYQKIKQKYTGSVTIVRAPATDVDFDESDEIYRWVREHTYEANDFALPSVLRKYKKTGNKKIAVILPSLNEERTVGQVIKTSLEVKNTGIIDEVILIDSASTDATVEIARSYGIPVYLHSDVRPELGTFRGKGEAMFKSAFVTDADILAWVDTDIENITPSFFYGLLGPILADPAIRFVKGYFERPVRVETVGIELGGGRVTEILVRPWINTYMPQLSGYIQPLAGTVATYRDLFLSMRIPVHYGVEIAMLIQAVRAGKVWSTCQVNLGEVIHKSKDVIGLSEMAFQILQVLSEMEEFGKVWRKNDVLRRFYSAHGHFEIGSKRFATVWRQYESGCMPDK